MRNLCEKFHIEFELFFVTSIVAKKERKKLGTHEMRKKNGIEILLKCNNVPCYLQRKFGAHHWLCRKCRACSTTCGSGIENGFALLKATKLKMQAQNVYCIIWGEILFNFHSFGNLHKNPNTLSLSLDVISPNPLLMEVFAAIMLLTNFSCLPTSMSLLLPVYFWAVAQMSISILATSRSNCAKEWNRGRHRNGTLKHLNSV